MTEWVVSEVDVLKAHDHGLNVSSHVERFTLHHLVPDKDLCGQNIILLQSTVLHEMLDITTDASEVGSPSPLLFSYTALLMLLKLVHPLPSCFPTQVVLYAYGEIINVCPYPQT